jgi:O-antigen ligase
MAQNHPFLGVGSYNYSLGFMASAPRDDSMKFIRTPQNTYIGLAAEKGLVGLAAYAFVLAMVLYSACSSLRLSKDTFDKIIVISLVTGLIATGTYFMTYYSALGNQGTAAMVITILACLDSIGKKETA